MASNNGIYVMANDATPCTWAVDHAYTVDDAMLVPNVQYNVYTGAICVYALCMITVLWSQD